MPLEMGLLYLCVPLLLVPGVRYVAAIAIPILVVIACLRFIGAVGEVADALDERLNR